MNDFFAPSPVSDCYHIYSNGTTMNVLFTERDEYIFMMNMLAVTSFANNITLLVTQVMDTHFHVIASGSQTACSKFTRDLSMKLGTFISKRKLSGRLEISMDPIWDSQELKNKIIYVYRNAITAGFPLAPWQYEWGPGDIYFVKHETFKNIGLSISTISATKKRKLFHTHLSLPDEWRVNAEGMIVPHCYIDWQRVEKLFLTIRAFIAFLYQKKDIEAAINSECASGAYIKYNEKDLRKYANDLCMDVFGKSLSQVDFDNKVAVARKVWASKRNVTVSALSRVVRVDKDVLRQVLGV